MAKEKAPIPSAAPAADKKKAISTAMSQIEKIGRASCRERVLIQV